MLEKDHIVITVDNGTRKLFCTAIENETAVQIPESIRKAKENEFREPIHVEDLFWLRDRLPCKAHFYEVLSKCEIVLPQPKIEPRNPILEARIQKLKKAEEERQYRAMTKNVDSMRVRHPEDTFAAQVKEIDRQLIGVLQLLVSVATGFLFGYKGIEWIVGNMETSARILLGIFCAIIIGIAELYFLIKKLSEPLPEPSTDKKNK